MAVSDEQIAAASERFGERRVELGMAACVDDEPTLRLIRAVMESNHENRLSNAYEEGA